MGSAVRIRHNPLSPSELIILPLNHLSSEFLVLSFEFELLSF